jgi:hypothetical protein
MTLEQIVNTHPCPIIRGKIMENVDKTEVYTTLDDLIFTGIIWHKTKEGLSFWNDLFKDLTAPYFDLKHLDNSYVPEPAKQPVMWRKIDANDIPIDVVLCANEDKSKIVINRIGINALDGTIQSHNRREFFEVNYYIPLSELINLPIQP